MKLSFLITNIARNGELLSRDIRAIACSTITCSIRLKGYDYSHAGAYFETICTRNRECLFGDIAGGTMRVNHFGKIVGEQ